jgi:uncharacterized protein
VLFVLAVLIRPQPEAAPQPPRTPVAQAQTAGPKSILSTSAAQRSGNSEASSDASQPPLRTIDDWKAKSYPGSAITVDKTVADTDLFTQYITSYYSDGLKISGLLTVPKGAKPPAGWPVLVWNHGGADPQKFGRQNDDDIGKNFASKGYLTYQPAYRGFAGSDGDPYDGAGYVTDSLNAIASIRRYDGADGSRIAVGGHSIGGAVTLAEIVISQEPKAAIIGAGAFVRFSESIDQLKQQASRGQLSEKDKSRWDYIQGLLNENGSPSQNPTFWQQYDFMAHLSDISTPIQLHVGLKDEAIPWQYSQQLYDALQRLGKPSELYTYPDGDHQLAGSTPQVFARMLELLGRELI